MASQLSNRVSMSSPKYCRRHLVSPCPSSTAAYLQVYETHARLSLEHGDKPEFNQEMRQTEK